MNIHRLINASMVAAIAIFFSIIAIDNLIDFDSNYIFVKHVMSMDTTFRHPAIMWRSITNEKIQKFVYLTIISWQILTAITCWIGSIQLYRTLSSHSKKHDEAVKISLLGLFFGFLLYMIGFIIIGGEWFSMWQSTVWNGQTKAGLFVTIIIFIMIFISRECGNRKE